MNSVAGMAVLFSVLFPSKLWFTPDQAINIQLRDAPANTTLVLMDSQGKLIDPEAPIEFSADRTVDITRPWRALRTPGAYVLLAVPEGKHRREFIGTPLVIDVRDDTRRDALPGPMVIKIDPLSYGVINTDKGEMSVLFFYDVAPNTVASFISLSRGGFYDGLKFHRLIPDFLIQGGDPRGDGTGGPGYHVEGEFSGRKHEEGVLSMARQVDPIESEGAMPRDTWANSAGSQFFICLNYKNTMQLDGRYSAFGKIIDGMDVLRELAKTPVDPKTDHPLQPPTINSIRILPVTAEHNPYADWLLLNPPSALPLGSPATMPIEP